MPSRMHPRITTTGTSAMTAFSCSTHTHIPSYSRLYVYWNTLLFTCRPTASMGPHSASVRPRSANVGPPQCKYGAPQCKCWDHSASMEPCSASVRPRSENVGPHSASVGTTVQVWNRGIAGSTTTVTCETVTRLMASFPGQPRQAGIRKVKLFRILMKQEMMG